jgi:hypothetical protein
VPFLLLIETKKHYYCNKRKHILSEKDAHIITKGTVSLCKETLLGMQDDAPYWARWLSLLTTETLLAGQDDADCEAK